MTNSLKNGINSNVKMVAKNLHVLLLYFALLLPSGVVHAVDGTWTNADTGYWSANGNWNGSIIADGSGSTADFSTIDITADVTVHLDSPRTNGNIIFGDTDTNTAAGWIMDNNGSAGNILTFAGGTPTISVNALGGTKAATITCVIAGSSGLTKTNPGTLRLTGANTYTGGTFVNGGTISINGAGAVNNQNITLNGGTFAPDGYTTPPQITIGPNGGTILNSSGWQSWNNDITGSGNCYYYNTGADDRFGRGAGYSLSGDFVVMANPPGQAKISSLPNSTLNITAATIGLNTANPVFGGLTGSQNLNLGGFVVQIGNNNKDTTYTGVLSGGSVTKIGTGTLTLTGANTFTGGTIISNGTLRIGNNGTSGSVPGSITNNATLEFYRSDSVVNTNVISGTGSVVMASSATLTLNSANTYSGATRVNAGTLSITNAWLCDTSSVYIATNAILNLNFAGTDTIGYLFLGSRAMTPGIYGNFSSADAFIEGSGTLTVQFGPPPVGTVVIIR